MQTIKMRRESKERKNDLIDLMLDAIKEDKTVVEGAETEELDQYEADTRTMVAAVRRMLFRWVEGRHQEATVRHLTKALFRNGEHDAIRCLEP